MKCDMSGGAAVIARDVGAAGARREDAASIGYVPLVENMPSGTAIRPGDVLTIRNGKTVEVLNTDAEGRLILADALSLASEDKPAAVDRPRHAHRRVHGRAGRQDRRAHGQRRRLGRPGARRRRPRRRAGVAAAAARRSTASSIESPVADIKNIGGSYGGALTAGLFLQEFVDGAPWVHLDIAGPAFRERRRRLPHRRAAPASACARWSSWPARSRRRAC